MSETIHGSCLCQSVSFQFHGSSHVFQNCHCSRCRKITGSAYASNIIIESEQFEWLSGEELVERFEHPQAKYFATSFCKQCGSSLPWRPQQGSAIVIPAGTLDDDPEIKPTQNIFWDSHAPWHLEVDALPKFEQFPPRKA